MAEGTTGLDYSDGATVEDRMLQQISAASDLSVLSPEIRALITDWPSRYHFDPGRANLLRPLRLRPQARILEVGAGCGAITRYLGESGFAVVAIEGSGKRAQIAAMRTRDLPGVRVVQGRLDEIDFDEPFDAVVLVGVLEYAAVYGDAGVDSHLALVRRCAELLGPDGVLVVAIENRLGLKYLAGAAEDHTGEPYIGINNGYAPDGPRTFTKSELSGLIAEAGLPVTQFLIPLPDYKIVRSVVRFSEAPEGSLLSLAHLVAASFHDDPQHRGIPPFSLEEAGAAMVSNGGFDALANSFLVLAARDEDSLAAVLDGREFGWSYAVARDPRFAKATVLCRAGDEISVEHRRLGPDPDSLPPLNQRLDSEPLQPGRSAWLQFVASVNRARWSVADVAEALRGWYQQLVDQADDGSGLVGGRHVDLAPFNVMVHNGQVMPFDQEWTWAEPIPKDWVALRGILFSIQMLTSAAEPAEDVPIDAGGLATAILDSLIGRDRLGSDPPVGFIEWLASVQALASGLDAAATRRALEDLWRREMPVRSAKVGLFLAAELDRLNVALAASHQAAAAEAERLNVALAASHQAAAAEAERLNAALAATQQAAAAEAERLNAALATQNEALATQNEALATQETTLRTSEQALMACQQTLNEVLTSKSWRVTVPLRAITQRLRRLDR